MTPITLECPAKVNLFLRVLAREDTGFHAIETLFCRVALHDTLEITRTDSGISLVVEGADVGPLEQNLAWRGAEAVLDATGRCFGVAMRHIKRIPAAAGLGGGSSDAASALLGVNSLANHAVPRSELFNMAHQLGSDVPFFLSEASLALAWGRGQRLLRLPPLPPQPMLLLVPESPVATAEAYQWVDEMRQHSGIRAAVALDQDVLARWSEIARLAGNDFESVVFGRFPPVRAAFEALARTRPLLCRMTGSGSTLFAVYRSERDRDDAVIQLGPQRGRPLVTTSA